MAAVRDGASQRRASGVESDGSPLTSNSQAASEEAVEGELTPLESGEEEEEMSPRERAVRRRQKEAQSARVSRRKMEINFADDGEEVQAHTPRATVPELRDESVPPESILGSRPSPGAPVDDRQ